MINNIKLIGFMLLCAAFSAESAVVATAKLVKGSVQVTQDGKSHPLKQEEGVDEGALIKTEDKSFVKLVFIDQSQMNVGPKSEMKIQKFSGKDSGVIDMMKGSLRSQVSKDYLQQKDKDKSKLFIKTSNAVMGIRGTDFLVTTQNNHTTTVLFEGSVAFNSSGSLRADADTQQMESVVSAGVMIEPGQFSQVDVNREAPTVPAAMNPTQLEALEKNVNFDKSRTPSNTTEANGARSIVPPGLSPKAASGNGEVIKNEISKVAGATDIPQQKNSANAEGFVSGSAVKPADGSFVHLESGTIVPPGAGSVYDPNTGTYIGGSNSGKISKDGEYIPLKQGNTSAGFEAGGATSAGVLSPGGMQPPPPHKNDILNGSFVPNALMDVTNLQQNTSGSTAIENRLPAGNPNADVKVIVNPCNPSCAP